MTLTSWVVRPGSRSADLRVRPSSESPPAFVITAACRAPADWTGSPAGVVHFWPFLTPLAFEGAVDAIGLVERVELDHVFVWQGEIEDLRVLVDSLPMGRLGDDRNIVLKAPAQTAPVRVSAPPAARLFLLGGVNAETRQQGAPAAVCQSQSGIAIAPNAQRNSASLGSPASRGGCGSSGSNVERPAESDWSRRRDRRGRANHDRHVLGCTDPKLLEGHRRPGHRRAP
jgi:hypothetical protein